MDFNQILIRNPSESIQEASSSFGVNFHLNSNKKTIRIFSGGLVITLFYEFSIKFPFEFH